MLYRWYWKKKKRPVIWSLSSNQPAPTAKKKKNNNKKEKKKRQDERKKTYSDLEHHPKPDIIDLWTLQHLSFLSTINAIHYHYCSYLQYHSDWTYTRLFLKQAHNEIVFMTQYFCTIFTLSKHFMFYIKWTNAILFLFFSFPAPISLSAPKPK